MQVHSCSRSIFVPIGALVVACGSTTQDPRPPAEWTLEDLTAEQGLSIRIPDFDVPVGVETQDCYFFAVPDLLGNGQDIWVSRVVSAVNPGSHHMNVFRVKTIKDLNPANGETIRIGAQDGTVIRGGECWKSGNWSDWPLVSNTQNSNPNNPYTDWKLPDGVGFALKPGEMLMAQTHYVNATTQKTPTKGRVGINFERTKGGVPAQELGTLFGTQQSIRVCKSRPDVSYSGTCRFPPNAVTINAANGHFHSRGTRFEAYTWDPATTVTPPDSDRFYLSTTWDDPPMLTGIERKVPTGHGIMWNCTYHWAEPEIGCDAVNAADKKGENDCCYTFGPKVETSEHCNVFLYYYPKVDRQDIFCN